ncbi:MAG TPA: DUF4397 domain-containing protein [Gemmatimonadaceae bacterium]
MSPYRYIIFGALLLGATACDKDTGGVTTPTVPLAQVRFLNAVPDTGTMDFRLVDYIENSPSFNAMAFRDNMPTYRPIQAGDRHIRVFMSGSDQAVASTVVVDTTFTFDENTHYTVILTGFIRPGGAPGFTTLILDDKSVPPPVPDDGHFALRVMNLGAGLGAVDAYWHRKSDATPGTQLGTSLDYLETSDYSMVEVTADSLRVAVTAPGTSTPLLTDALVNLGVPGTATVNPAPGTKVGGSVMTAVILPPSVAGSQAPQTSAFTNPTVIILYDNRPPNTAN